MLKILFVLIIIYIVYRIVTIIVILLSDYHIGRDLSKSFTLDGYKINEYGNEQLYKCKSPYIVIFPINLRTILWKYEIEDYGPVWRWSKLHKDIKRKFKELKDE